MRANVGVPPSTLLDQHLIAEYRELLIPAGQQRKYNWDLKAPIPPSFRLGQGHITFWRDKHLYLKRRHEALISEMIRRDFSPNLEYWDMSQIPTQFQTDWSPSREESLLVRERILSRFLEKPYWYRLRGQKVVPEEYSRSLLESPVFF